MTKNSIYTLLGALLVGLAAYRLRAEPWAVVVAVAPIFALSRFLEAVERLQQKGLLGNVLRRVRGWQTLLDMHAASVSGSMSTVWGQLMRAAIGIALILWFMAVLALWQK